MAVTLGARVPLVGEVLELKPCDDDAETPTRGCNLAGEGTADTPAAFGAVTAVDKTAIS